MYSIVDGIDENMAYPGHRSLLIESDDSMIPGNSCGCRDFTWIECRGPAKPYGLSYFLHNTASWTGHAYYRALVPNTLSNNVVQPGAYSNIGYSMNTSGVSDLHHACEYYNLFVL